MISNIKPILFSILFCLLGIYTGYFVGLWEGKISGAKDEKLNTYEKTEKVRVNNEKRKTEVRQLDDIDLIRRYCRSSVFDIPYDECVRTVTYVK